MLLLKSVIDMIDLNSAYNAAYNLKNKPDNEFHEIIADLIDNPTVKSLSQYVQHMDIDRLQHVIAVSYVSYLICKLYNLDFKAAARAGLLHDLFLYDWHSTDDGLKHRLHGYRHPGFALVNARKLTNLSKVEENIIIRHMWPLTPTPPAYKEALVVSLVDKYCATRECVYCITLVLRRKRKTI